MPENVKLQSTERHVFGAVDLELLLDLPREPFSALQFFCATMNDDDHHSSKNWELHVSNNIDGESMYVHSL